MIRHVNEVSTTTFDYIIIASKALRNSDSSTAELVRPAVSKDTTIVLIQNGIGIEDEYMEAYPINTLLSCVVYLPATQTRPGYIEMGDLEMLQIGLYPVSDDEEKIGRRDAFAEVIGRGNGTAKTFHDVQEKRWSKLLVNVGWNPVCALARSRDVDVLAAADEAEDFVKGVMMEVALIAQAFGYEGVNEHEVDRQLDRAKARIGTKGIMPSMMHDALHERRMEVDAIVGNTMRLGKQKGISVPRLEGLYVLTKALDARFAEAKN